MPKNGVEALEPSAALPVQDMVPVIGATIWATTALLTVLMSFSEWQRTRRETFRFLGWAFALVVLQQASAVGAGFFTSEAVRALSRLITPVWIHFLESCFLILLSGGMAIHERGRRGELKRLTSWLMQVNLVVTAIVAGAWYFHSQSTPGLLFGDHWGEWVFAVWQMLLLGLGVYLAFVLKPGIRVGPALTLLAVGKAAHILQLLLAGDFAISLALIEWVSGAVAALMMLAAAHFGIVTETFTDALTRLHNRRYFMNRVTEEFDRAQRRESPLSVMVMDLDRFKRFNDTHGHIAGDRLLKAVARTLNRHLRPYDILCRWGGEEFIALLPDTPPEVAERVAERLRIHIADTFGAPDREAPVTISIGVASWPHTGAHWRDVVEAADQAVYKAKTWRNRVVVVGDAPGPSSR